jgi:hypothetical protein
LPKREGLPCVVRFFGGFAPCRARRCSRHAAASRRSNLAATNRPPISGFVNGVFGCRFRDRTAPASNFQTNERVCHASCVFLGALRRVERGAAHGMQRQADVGKRHAALMHLAADRDVAADVDQLQGLGAAMNGEIGGFAMRRAFFWGLCAVSSAALLTACSGKPTLESTESSSPCRPHASRCRSRRRC